MFVRRDLSLPQQVVQASHAILEATKNKPYINEHPYVIVIGIKTLEALKKAFINLSSNNINVYPFYESDLNNEMTAFATDQIFGERPKIFRKYQLLK